MPGYVGSFKKGNFLAVLASQRMGGDPASRAIDTKWSDWAGLPDQAKLWEYVRTTKVVKDEDLQKVGDAGEALKTPNAKIAVGELRFRDPHARVDRAVVRGRRVRRRQADRVERVAADPPGCASRLRRCWD